MHLTVKVIEMDLTRRPQHECPAQTLSNRYNSIRNVIPNVYLIFRGGITDLSSNYCVAAGLLNDNNAVVYVHFYTDVR